MKVKAKTNIKIGTGWFSAGKVFEVQSLAGLEGLVEAVGGVPAAQPETQPEPSEDREEKAPVRRSRKRVE